MRKDNFIFDVCVVGGCGHVGLPLAIAFASKGLKVSIYDINTQAIEMVKQGIMPFIEEGAEEILKKVINNTLFVSSDREQVSQSKFIIIIVGTPVDEHLNPDFKLINKLLSELKEYFRNGQIIILRSTVYPGTTEFLKRKIEEFNLNIDIAFCPERILEGKAMEELFSLPQIVSGFRQETIEEVSTLFKKLTNDIVVVNPLEAELAKLFTNAWRYIQFAVANQFYMMAEEYDANFYNIFHAMKFKYPRTANLPRPGFAAGPCLFKDTMQLSAFSNNRFFLGHSAMLVNEGLPDFVVQQLKKKFNLIEKKVGILGMAFKANSDDKRESLSYKLRKVLQMFARNVLCSDPFINDPSFVSEEQLIDESDIIILAVPHSKYKELDFKGKYVYDIWGFVSKKQE